MSTTTLTERLVTRLAGRAARRPSRRSMIAAATLSGAALAVDPWGYLTRPQSAYASVCGPGASCDDGWSVMCCSINDGHNTCPPNTYPGGWWKADRSSFCGGAARYYIDCNAKPGHHFHCHCHEGSCDHRYVACNVFRYGQCNTQIEGVTAVVCRQISCLPPWQLYPGDCGHSSATDNNTAKHNAPCLTKHNTYPRHVTFPSGEHEVTAGHYLRSTHRLTSPDRHTEAVMQADGDFVIRNVRGVVWRTHTAGMAKGGRLFVRADGRLLLYDAHGSVRWSTHHRTDKGNPVLRLRDNGRLTVDTAHERVWQTAEHPEVIVLALVVAVVAAVRGLWSPCGLSMLSSLNPVSESARGHRFAPTAGWYVLGAAAGGALLGGACALVAAGVGLLPSAGSWPWIVALVVALAAAASDSTSLRFALPVHPRQVDERWLGRYRRWIYAGGFGLQIGTGFATYVMSGTVYLAAALAALTASPRQALAVGLVFGTVRGLGILVVAPVRDAARLRRLLGAVERLGPASLRVTGAVAVAAGATAAVAAAGRAPAAAAGVLVAAALWASADAVTVASRRRRTVSDEPLVRRSTVGQCPTMPERAVPARST